MAKTFKDFIIECENFEYSQEYYDLMKECSELSLMEKYIENQLYLMDNPITESVSLDNGYLMESANESELEIITEKALEKAKGIGNKIWSGLKRMLNSVVSFFKKYVLKLDDIDEKAKKVKKEIPNIMINKNLANYLVDSLKSKSDENKNFGLASKTQEIKCKWEEDVSAELSGKVKHLLYMALSDSTILVDASVLYSNRKYSPIPLDAIVSVCKSLIKKQGKYDVVGAKSTLEAAVRESKSKGLHINASAAKVKKAISALEDLYQNLEAKAQDNAIKYAGGSDDPNKADMEVVASLNQVYSLLTGCVGATISAYSSFLKFKIDAVNTLYKYVTQNKSSRKEEKKNNKNIRQNADKLDDN